MSAGKRHQSSKTESNCASKVSDSRQALQERGSVTPPENENENASESLHPSHPSSSRRDTAPYHPSSQQSHSAARDTLGTARDRVISEEGDINNYPGQSSESPKTRPHLKHPDLSTDTLVVGSLLACLFIYDNFEVCWSLCSAIGNAAKTLYSAAHWSGSAVFWLGGLLGRAASRGLVFAILELI